MGDASLGSGTEHSIQPLSLKTPASVLHVTASGQGQQPSHVKRRV